MANILVISHADPDGDMSGAIVHYFEDNGYNKIDHIKINYGQPIPWDKIKKADKVYMVDFGAQPFSDMIKILNMKGDSFIWIDHHETAVKDMIASGQKFNGIQEYNKVREESFAGCELTWKYFTDDEMPMSVKTIGRFDVWDLRYNDLTFPFICGLGERDSHPASPVMKALIEDEGTLFNKILSEGQIIKSYLDKKNAGLCESFSFEIEWEGHSFLVSNSMGVNSTFFDSKIDYSKHDAMMVFYMLKSGRWSVGMYTIKPGIHVGNIAKKWGGGGHAGAAGFQTDDILTILGRG